MVVCLSFWFIWFHLKQRWVAHDCHHRGKFDLIHWPISFWAGIVDWRDLPLMVTIISYCGIQKQLFKTLSTNNLKQSAILSYCVAWFAVTLVWSIQPHDVHHGTCLGQCIGYPILLLDSSHSKLNNAEIFSPVFIATRHNITCCGVKPFVVVPAFRKNLEGNCANTG